MWSRGSVVADLRLEPHRKPLSRALRNWRARRHSKARPSRMAKKLKLQESEQLSRSAWSRRALSATFFGAINGADCEPANNWGRLMEWARILAYITGTLDQELLLRNEYLAAENQILRGQLKGRPKLSDAERAKLGEIGRRLGRKALGDLATAALPDTILGWYRRLGARKFDGSKHRSPGRPRVERAIEELIVRMASRTAPGAITGLWGPWPIWGLKFPTKRWEMFCAAAICRRRRSASARPHGRPSFGPTWRCWRGPTSSRRKC